MVRKKEVVKPVAAKPLPQNNVTKNDTNLVNDIFALKPKYLKEIK